MIKAFVDLLNKSLEIHKKKNSDYASEENKFENFERSALIASWFNKPIDKVFITLITTKLTRLATLLNKSTQPNNESTEDSFLDLVTYCGLWGAEYEQNKIKNQTIQFLTEHNYIYNSEEQLWKHPKDHMAFFMTRSGVFSTELDLIKSQVFLREAYEKTNVEEHLGNRTI